MKRCLLIVCGFLFLPAGTHAQTAAETIERALAAAPSRAREATAVIKWNPDFSYQTLKEGSNQMVCYDRSGEPGQPAFSVQCTSMANLPRVAQNRRFGATSANAQENRAKVAAADADGTRILPEYGSVWIAMRGADQASAGIHTTIAVPGATTASTGLPENGRAGGAYIMDAGTSGAHIMTPGS